jgi:hypothetical protein
LDAAISVLERAAPAGNQRVRALKFLRGTLQGQASQADADRAANGGSEHLPMPRPAKR